MKKREAKFQTIFNQYVRTKRLHGAFELKQTTTDRLPFNALEPHQTDGLLAFQNSGIVFKLSDEDQRQKPFDSLSVPPLNAYVVIKYPDFFCLILIDDWIKEKVSTFEKSLTSQRAKDIASLIVYA